MSLDVMLMVGDEEVYWANITHNLNGMAGACGVYRACWRPEEINASKAAHIIPLLKDGIENLEAHPAHFKQFDAKNGWGTYDDFLPWLKSYLEVCERYPDADLRVSR
ncbi:MAG: hypothetical protein ACRCXB_33365 [Aeromonadaceae bacterium]